MIESKDTAFSEEQFDRLYPLGVERHYWSRCRNKVIARTLRKAGAKGPLLEIGCGKGVVVHYLREQGFDITGVELAPVVPLPVVAAHVRTGVDVMDMDPEVSAHIRTVLLLDVIEHIEDPVAFIAAIRRKLPALECIVVTVPARQELFSNFDTFNGHFRRYDREMLHAHMDPDKRLNHWSSYVFHSLYPAARMQLSAKGEREVGFNVPKNALSNMVHAMLGLGFYLEYLVLPKRWKGTSIIGVVKG